MFGSDTNIDGSVCWMLYGTIGQASHKVKHLVYYLVVDGYVAPLMLFCNGWAVKIWGGPQGGAWQLLWEVYRPQGTRDY